VWTEVDKNVLRKHECYVSMNVVLVVKMYGKYMRLGNWSVSYEHVYGDDL